MRHMPDEVPAHRDGIHHLIGINLFAHEGLDGRDARRPYDLRITWRRFAVPSS